MADMRNRAAHAIGVDDPKVSAFRMDVQDKLARYVHEISGAASSDNERAQLMGNIPTMADSDETFKAKAAKLYNHLSSNRDRYVSGLAKIGRDPSAFLNQSQGGGAPPAGFAGPAPSADSKPPPAIGTKSFYQGTQHEFKGGNPNDKANWPEVGG